MSAHLRSKDRTIRFLGRDFGSFKRELIRFAQAHHSGVFSDFNEVSPGMAILEMQAYVGDVLSFYIDDGLNALVRGRARRVEDVAAVARQLGYKPRGASAANVPLTFAVEVPSTRDARGELVPDPVYTPVLLKNARAVGPNDSVFESMDDVKFSSSLDGRSVSGSRFDSAGGPTHFAIFKTVDAAAGQTKTATYALADFKRFRTIEIDEDDVLEVVDVVDSDGNEWHEVDFLAQDAVFDQTANTGADLEDVPYILRLVAAPRRFVTQWDPGTNRTTLTFGSGDAVNFDDDLIPNLADLALPLAGRRTYSSYAIDPQNFLKTRTLGLSPYDTTLTVRYRVGGGLSSNVPPGSIRDVANAELEFAAGATDARKKGDVESSLSCYNYVASRDGASPETIDDIFHNSTAFFAAQDRAVTREDYVARVLSLPKKFGRPEKVHVRRSAGGSIDIHVLTRDSGGHLATASSNLKANLRTYLSRYRMLTDNVAILDGAVVNIGVVFSVTVGPAHNRTTVVSECIRRLAAELSVDRVQIGGMIVVSELISLIQDVSGVVSVYDVRFTSLAGTVDGRVYSSRRFDVEAALVDGVLRPPDGAVLEVKFPRSDIVGSAR